MSKKLVQINVVCNGSTGRIMNQIQSEAISQGWEAYSFYGRGKPSNDKCYKIGNKLDVLWHVFLSRFLGKHGHGSKRATKQLVKKIKEINPDVIQLHNIHGYYIHMETLFKYLKTCDKKIIWTLHDCWAFTGHCTYFTYPKCDKWQNGCNGKCIRKQDYPKSIINCKASREYKIKKRLFTGMQNLTIVTPSDWLANLVKKSFLKDNEIRVINNGIDLNMFKPVSVDGVKEKYNIPYNKKIILGVAAIWDKRKGLDDFIELSREISDDTIIILIGLNAKQIESLPNNIIGIKRTENIEELVKLYNVADILFNPSKEETFSLVTAEAMACGTPALVYDNSATKELIPNFAGVVASETWPLQKIINELEKIILQKDKNKNKLVQYVSDKFNILDKTREYFENYKN